VDSYSFFAIYGCVEKRRLYNERFVNADVLSRLESYRHRLMHIKSRHLQDVAFFLVEVPVELGHFPSLAHSNAKHSLPDRFSNYAVDDLLVQFSAVVLEPEAGVEVQISAGFPHELRE
jgi:hypothetical protein